MGLTRSWGPMLPWKHQSWILDGLGKLYKTLKGTVRDFGITYKGGKTQYFLAEDIHSLDFKLSVPLWRNHPQLGMTFTSRKERSSCNRIAPCGDSQELRLLRATLGLAYNQVIGIRMTANLSLIDQTHEV